MRRSLVPIVFLVSLLVFSSFAFAQTRTLNLLGISGWTPSELALKMAPAFEEYAREKLGYEVRVTADFAPFTALYEKAAAALAARSSQYDIIIVSQWLVHLQNQANDSMSSLKLTVFKSIWDYVSRAYYACAYPTILTCWGFPQVGDNLMYVRKDLRDPEQADLRPSTDITADLRLRTTGLGYFVNLGFFTRPPGSMALPVSIENTTSCPVTQCHDLDVGW